MNCEQTPLLSPRETERYYPTDSEDGSTRSLQELEGPGKKYEAVILDEGERALASMGYTQDLNRSISAFSNFSVAFGCCSVLSGLTPLWGTALMSGGTIAVVWGWPIVSIMTLGVALSLAEICSAYPITGGLYIWVSKLADPKWAPLCCWLTGWFNWLGLCFAVTSTDLSLAKFLTGIISVVRPTFQTTVYIDFVIFLGVLLTHGLINSMAIKYNGIFNQVSVWWHLVGVLMIVIVGLALTPNKASPEFVFTYFENDTGFSSNAYGFFIGLLQCQYTLSGYDSAAQLADETRNAAIGSPYGILMSVGSAAVTGWVFLLGVTFLIQNFQAQIVNASVSPEMVQVFLDGVGQGWTIVFTGIIMGAMFFCGSALLLGSSRMVYSFGRDGGMIFSNYLHRIEKQTKAPLYAVWFNTVMAGIVGIPYMFSSTAFSAIVSVNTIASSVAYLIPIVLRNTHSLNTFERGPFHLGKFSFPIGIVASLWIMFTTVFFLLPTKSPVTASNFNYSIAAFGVVVGLSSGYFVIWGRHWFKGPQGQPIPEEF